MLGNRGDAALHFDAALAANEQTGARPWLARTQHDYARLLLAEGEGERGRELLDAALATYRELGMTGYLAEAEALLKQ
jgi:hypothetical protein